jgi:UDPglucose--hexose-1-phosphate uridylyltransferase
MANSPLIQKETLSGREVIYAAHRRQRPLVSASSGATSNEKKKCPFCPGNEAILPDILWEQDDENSWNARAVSNLFPIVSPPDGHHEVIIDAPEHVLPVGAMTEEQWRSVLAAYSARLHSLSRLWSYVSLFRNVGRRAGGSIDHPHSQLIALAQTPEHVEARLQRLQQTYDATGHCPLCEDMQDLNSFAERIVTQNATFVAFAPSVAEVPLEIWITSLLHSSDFCMDEPADHSALAEILADVFNRFACVLGDFDHNLMLMDNHREPQPYLHWFLRIRPVGGPIGGFERVTGIAVNETSPEEDAASLRQAFAIPDMDNI